MQHGGDLTIQNAEGLTPLQVASSEAIRTILNDSMVQSNTLSRTHSSVSLGSDDVMIRLPETSAELLQKNRELENEIQRLKEALEDADDQLKTKDMEVHYLKEKNDSLREENDDLLKQIETYSTHISQITEDKTAIVQQNGELLKKVEILKQNQIAVILSEMKLQNQQKYEIMLEELKHFQSLLLSERDVSVKQQLIAKRNAKRREIVECIDEIVKNAQSQLTPRAESLVQELIDKKLQFLFPMKNQLVIDISMEQELIEMSSQSVTAMQQQLEVHRENLRVLERMNFQDHIASTKQLIKELEQKIQKQKESLSLVSKRKNPLFGFPELQESLVNSLYQEKIDDLNKLYKIEKMDTNFCIGTKKDTNAKVFVKRYGKVDDWRHFKNAVETLQKLNHQCVVTINKAMFDEHFYYIEMPFIEKGTLYDWLLKSTMPVHELNSINQRTPFEVQRMMRLVIQTIDYLHENGVVHRDLKMENILMQNDAVPVIIDFDMSKDCQNSQRLSVSTMAGGTLKYIDPQVQWGKASLNTKSDIYSYGVTLLKCFSKFPLKMEMIPMPDKEVPDLKSSDLIVEDDDLVQLLKKCLHIEQDKRPTAKEIVYCPFFMKHMSNEQEDQKKQEAATRLQAFKKFILEKKSTVGVDRNGNFLRLGISIKEDNLETELGEKLMNAPAEHIYRTLFVKFEGQEGIDAGGLTTSLFRKYFSKLLEINILEKGSSCIHICSDSYVPKSQRRSSFFFQSIGFVLAKCIVEQRSIGAIQFSNVLLKYLLAKDTSKVKASLVDLEQLDAKLSNQLSNMRLMEDVSLLSLDFSGLKPHGEDIELINQNLEEYISLKCQYEMISSRKEHLDCIREGFYMMPELNDHFQLLQVNDYHILLTGEQMIDIPSIITHCVAFLEDEHEEMQQWLREILLSFSQEDFKQFLLFCTGYCTTRTKDSIFENQNPHSSFDCDKINIRFTEESSDSLPVAHLCFYVLDMPVYNSKKQLEQKLKYAILNTSDIFAIV